MSSGGGNTFENLYGEIEDAEKKLTGGSFYKDYARETKKGYDEVDGTNARKRDQSGKNAEKNQKKQIAKAKKKVSDKKDLDKARSDAEDSRDSMASRSVKKKAKKGRSGTILTDSLGVAGGSENQGKKNLLGL